MAPLFFRPHAPPQSPSRLRYEELGDVFRNWKVLGLVNVSLWMKGRLFGEKRV